MGEIVDGVIDGINEGFIVGLVGMIVDGQTVVGVTEGSRDMDGIADGTTDGWDDVGRHIG